MFGVSPDTVQAQKKFADKYDLPFTLVADADKKICTLYGVIQEKNNLASARVIVLQGELRTISQGRMLKRISL